MPLWQLTVLMVVTFLGGFFIGWFERGQRLLTHRQVWTALLRGVLCGLCVAAVVILVAKIGGWKP